MILLRVGCGCRGAVNKEQGAHPVHISIGPRSERTVVVGWDEGTYGTYGTYDYGTMRRGDCFVGDNETMGQHHAPRTMHHAPRTAHYAPRTSLSFQSGFQGYRIFKIAPPCFADSSAYIPGNVIRSPSLRLIGGGSFFSTAWKKRSSMA